MVRRWPFELASCNFESIHQKEFRLLGVNLNVNKLYHPCTRDHPHVKIEGKYTKASAVYTDALASRIADVLGEELRIKKAASNYFDIKIEGLESVLSNHFALASEWKEVKSWTWKKKVHINVLEAAAYGRLCYHAAVHHPRSRFPVGMDSNVALSSIIKGRSPSYALRPSLRRIGATTVVGCLYPAHHFFPTRMNPSDHPTRNSIIPPSSKGGKLPLRSSFVFMTYPGSKGLQLIGLVLFWLLLAPPDLGLCKKRVGGMDNTPMLVFPSRGFALEMSIDTLDLTKLSAFQGRGQLLS